MSAMDESGEPGKVDPTFLRSELKLRLGPSDARYEGGLVSGGRLMELFGDVATELSIRMDGNEGLFRAYSDVEFLAPVRTGDFLEVRGRVVKVNRSSRECEFDAYKVIAAPGENGRGGVLEEPLLVARGVGTIVSAAILQGVGHQ